MSRLNSPTRHSWRVSSTQIPTMFQSNSRCTSLSHQYGQDSQTPRSSTAAAATTLRPEGTEVLPVIIVPEVQEEAAESEGLYVSPVVITPLSITDEGRETSHQPRRMERRIEYESEHEDRRTSDRDTSDKEATNFIWLKYNIDSGRQQKRIAQQAINCVENYKLATHSV